MRSVFWLATSIAAVVLVPFAIANRAPVSLGLWPLPFLLETPVYLLVLLTLLAGFVIGVGTAWIPGRRVRRELRRQRRHVEALERELAATQAQLVNQPDSGGSRLPAIPTNVAPPRY